MSLILTYPVSGYNNNINTFRLRSRLQNTFEIGIRLYKLEPSAVALTLVQSLLLRKTLYLIKCYTNAAKLTHFTSASICSK